MRRETMRLIVTRFLVLAAFAWIFTVPASALTLSDIETAVRRNIRDTSSTAAQQRYTDTVLDAIINEGQREVVNFTWCVQTSTSRVLSSQTTYYSLPTDLISIEMVTFRDSTNQTIELDEYSEAKAYSEEGDFERSSSGAPDHYFVRYSTSGGNALEIAYLPVPTTSSTGTVRVLYNVQATDLSSDSDVPFDGLNHLYQYHVTLVYYATYRIKLMEGMADEAALYIKLYEAAIATMKDRLGRAPNYSPNVKAAPR